MEITIRQLNPTEIHDALVLADKVFTTQNACAYPEESARVFRTNILNNPKFISDYEQGRCPMFGAFFEDALVGMLAMNIGAKRINLLFVDVEHQNMGIGTSMVDFIFENEPECDDVFINCPQAAIPFFFELGFVPIASSMSAAGITFVPMRCSRTQRDFDVLFTRGITG